MDIYTSEKAWIVGRHPYCFRVGEVAEIIGVKIVKPDKKSLPRLSYEVEFFDGIIDYVPVSEIGTNYKIITFNEILSGDFNLNK